MQQYLCLLLCNIGVCCFHHNQFEHWHVPQRTWSSAFSSIHATHQQAGGIQWEINVTKLASITDFNAVITSFTHISIPLWKIQTCKFYKSCLLLFNIALDDEQMNTLVASQIKAIWSNVENCFISTRSSVQQSYNIFKYLSSNKKLEAPYQ